MASTPQYPPGGLVIPALPPPSRHALGLPAGSVRALLTLMVVGLVCALILIPPRDPGRPNPLPAYLLYLLFLILGHYFAAHGNTIKPRGHAGPSPLYLPAGFIRFIVAVGLSATIIWQWVNHREEFLQQLQDSVTVMRDQPFLPLVLLVGFFVGVVVRTLVGRQNPPYWWQDIEAWFALLGVIGLCIEVLIHFVINPTLEKPLELPNWEGFLAAIVAFYFGARS
jgi:hypothetical protein